MTTIQAIAKGGYEKNPVQVWFQKNLGGAWWVSKLLFVPLAVVLALLPAPMGLIAAFALDGIYGTVVWNNYKLTQ